MTLFLCQLVWFGIKKKCDASSYPLCKKIPIIKDFFKDDDFSEAQIDGAVISFGFLLLLFTVSVFCFFRIINIFFGESLPIEVIRMKNVFYAIFTLMMGFFSVFASREVNEKKDAYDHHEMSCLFLWYKGLALVSFISSAIFFCNCFFNRLVGSYFIDAIDYVFYILFLYILFICLEMCFRYIRCIFEVLNTTLCSDEHGNAFFLNILFSRDTISKSFLHAVKKEIRIDLSNSQIIHYFLLVAEPVCILSIITFWLMTTIVIVPVDEQAVIRRCGTFVNNSYYEPGIHLSCHGQLILLNIIARMK